MLLYVTAKLFSEKRGGAWEPMEKDRNAQQESLCPNRGIDPPMSNFGASPASTLEVHPPVHLNQKHQNCPSECGKEKVKGHPTKYRSK